MIRFVETLLVLVLAVLGAFAQTQTTGQISGTVSDTSGAVLPQTKITVTSKDTGFVRTTETNSSGYYVVPLLLPGHYTVSVTVQSFQTIVRDGLSVEIGHAHLVDFRLQPGSINEKVTVTAQAPLIEPSNPNTTTTFEARQLSDLPNPGNDLSYFSTLAPGAIGTTQASSADTGGGNVEFNGLPAQYNDFTIDGLDANNTFGNSNSTGASGLQLGSNAIEEVSINTAAYAVDQGRSGASQINFVTKSGANQFHGNAWWLWNGSALNARNFFLNANGVQQKPRSNVNQFAASLGGPIWKNKLFFFGDLEGVRLLLPAVQNSTLPRPEYQAYVLQQLTVGGTDPQDGTQFPATPQLIPFYQNMFQLMGDTTRGQAIPVLDCPFDVGGVTPTKIPGSGDGCANTRVFSSAPITSETLFTFRVDYKRNDTDNFWYRFQVNTGHNTVADPVNPVFNQIASIPIRTSAAGWTHIFNAHLVNQFNPGISYRSAIFDVADPAKAHAAAPLTYGGSPFSLFGGGLSFLPNGTAATVWQLNDNLIWNKGKHTVQFGENLRRVLTTTRDGTLIVPQASACTLAEYTYGATCVLSQSLAKDARDRIGQINLDTYAMDTFQAGQKLTVTLGLRVGWNSNPVSQHHLFSRLNGSFASISHDVNRPLNLDILANQSRLFRQTPLLQWQPRVAIAYSIRPSTVLRAGFGVFAQALETSHSFFTDENAPTRTSVTTGLHSTIGGSSIAPGVPNSAVDAAANALSNFETDFVSGALSCASPLAAPDNCLAPVVVTDYAGDGTGRMQYPYTMQWSSALEHQLRRTVALTVKYQGTAGRHMFYQENPDMFQTFCPGCFGLPFNSAPDPRFSNVSSQRTGANSSYHALQATIAKQLSHGLAFQANYTYSHCLDFVSNGGTTIYSFASVSSSLNGPLRDQYGNCDYDIRNSLNGFAIYEFPVHTKSRWLNGLAGGWQVSSAFFVRGGLPVSVASNEFSTGGFGDQSPFIFANTVAGQNPYAKHSLPTTFPGTVQWLNPDAFQSVVDPTSGNCVGGNDPQHCQNGNAGRNSVRAPRYVWTDMVLTKQVKISERATFKLDVQLFNLFNHPNLGLPSIVAGLPGNPDTQLGFGAISTAVASSTGLLGRGLGGDNSARMIAFRGRIEF